MDKTRLYMVVISALISVFCFPPFKFGPFIFIMLIPLFLAVENLSPFSAFKYGLLWGVLFYLGYIYYIAWVTIPGMIAAVLILSLIPATAFWIYIMILRRRPFAALVFLPSYFLMWNWLFTMSDLNYPWMDIGYALGYYLPFIQIAEFGGVYLVSLFILVINLILYVSVSSKFGIPESTGRKLRYVSALAIIIIYIFGMWRIPNKAENNGEGITVALLQGNMTRDIKWNPEFLQENFDRYFELSQEAAREGADLIVWPETATPTYLVQYRNQFKLFRDFVDSIGIPILTGTPYYEVVGQKEYIYFNSAVLVEPNISDYVLYRKVHLVPMSEKIPFSGKFKILKEIRLGQADWSNGSEQTIFETSKYKFGTVICIESVYPDYCRKFARKGAQFLAVITNDMWFGKTSLLEQHAMMSVFRAVENRIPVVRSANTGISMAIDKWGRILKKSDIFTREYLVQEIYPETSASVYGRIGDIIPKTALALVILSIAVAFAGRKQYNKGV